MICQIALREIENVPLSDSTVSQRIDDMAHDIEEVLRDKLKNSNFSIQVNESTDLTNNCHFYGPKENIFKVYEILKLQH
ncbi:Hypothetical predicted protein [Octopus vulgaris]|uniref:Uncharacterized protein n=1 Tax=Octopus vulgaris TaxID=6645 RepID=A0AA36AKX7_OCTVU|nr:Hypothetical predicted protein [Octopus vulgaris]